MCPSPDRLHPRPPGGSEGGGASRPPAAPRRGRFSSRPGSAAGPVHGGRAGWSNRRPQYRTDGRPRYRPPPFVHDRARDECAQRRSQESEPGGPAWRPAQRGVQRTPRSSSRSRPRSRVPFGVPPPAESRGVQRCRQSPACGPRPTDPRACLGAMKRSRAPVDAPQAPRARAAMSRAACSIARAGTSAAPPRPVLRARSRGRQIRAVHPSPQIVVPRVPGRPSANRPSHLTGAGSSRAAIPTGPRGERGHE